MSHLKLKKLLSFIVRFELLDGLLQGVNSFRVGDSPEARVCNMPEPVPDLWVRVAVNLGRAEILQVLSAEQQPI